MRETRIFAAPVEVREAQDNVATIVGYGAVFDNEYEVMGFTESVDRKAFTKTLKERDDLAVVVGHDANRVLGTEGSGTARFDTDERGLRYEADLDLLDPDGISMQRKISLGKVRQSSFSFQVIKDAWEERDDAPPHRTLKEVRLYECSPVLWGANPDTEVDVQRAARSLAKAAEGDADTLEKAIREGHLTDALHRDATATEPSPEPGDRSEDTPEPEPKRVFHPYR